MRPLSLIHKDDLMRLARCCAALLLLFGTSSACLSVTGPGGDHEPTGTYRVLLIGNSLTYQNHLPQILEALADSARVEDLYVQMVAFPNFALEDHVTQGDAIREIRKGGWTYVVMQQGPSALLTSRAHLIQWARVLEVEIRAVGAIPAFYAVWPAAERAFDFPGVQASYDSAAVVTNGALIPAGEAWQAAWRLDSSLRLYDVDNFHPANQGTYLAALVMLQRFYPTLSPLGLPAAVRLASANLVFSVPAANAPTLQAAALEAHTRFGRAGTP